MSNTFLKVGFMFLFTFSVFAEDYDGVVSLPTRRHINPYDPEVICSNSCKRHADIVQQTFDECYDECVQSFGRKPSKNVANKPISKEQALQKELSQCQQKLQVLEEKDPKVFNKLIRDFKNIYEQKTFENSSKARATQR